MEVTIKNADKIQEPKKIKIKEIINVDNNASTSIKKILIKKIISIIKTNSKL